MRYLAHVMSDRILRGCTAAVIVTQGVMYHLDFETLGQPLCKAGQVSHELLVACEFGSLKLQHIPAQVYKYVTQCPTVQIHADTVSDVAHVHIARVNSGFCFEAGLAPTLSCQQLS